MENTWQKMWQGNKEYPIFTGENEKEVVIIGGGITGITLAYLLAKGGKKVIVLEKGTLEKSSATAYSTAMLTGQIDTGFSKLIKMFSKSKAVKIWQSGMDAIDNIEKSIVEEKIECDFIRTPLYVYANNKKEWQALEEDAESAKEVGFRVSIKDSGLDLGIPNLGYYKLENQAKFDPLKYAQGLRTAAEKYGANFYENSEVLEVKAGKYIFIRTNNGDILANFAVIATYDPFNKPKELFAKKGTYVTYMLELALPKGKLKEGLYVDYDNPYHYFRVDRMEDKDRVLIGGADHRKEIKMDPEKNYTDVHEYAKKIFSNEFEITNRWSGKIIEPSDGLPLIGAYSKETPNILVATAFSGNGFTHSRTASQIIADKILGKKNIYSEIFDPKRDYSVKALVTKGQDYVKEFFNGALRNMFRHK